MAPRVLCQTTALSLTSTSAKDVSKLAAYLIAPLLQTSDDPLLLQDEPQAHNDGTRCPHA